MKKTFRLKFNIILFAIPLLFCLRAMGEKGEKITAIHKNSITKRIEQEGQPSPVKKTPAPAPHYNYSNKSHMIRFDAQVDKPIHAKVWFDTSAYYQFSDPNSQDRFWLKAVGDYDYKATVFFKIINAKGQIIYRDSFPLMEILGIYIDGGGYYATRTKKEEAMAQYVEEFFYESNMNVTENDLLVPVTEENYIVENHQAFQNEKPLSSFVYSKVANGQSLIGYHPTLGVALKFYEYK